MESYHAKTCIKQTKWCAPRNIPDQCNMKDPSKTTGGKEHKARLWMERIVPSEKEEKTRIMKCM
eukprot:8785478-Karenia_brevis.AAC.1